MAISYHRLLAAAALLGLALIGCASSSTAPSPRMPAQIIADANGAVIGLGVAINGIAASSPGLIPPATVAALQGILAQSDSTLTSLSTSLPAPAGASILQQVGGSLNSILTTLALFKSIPPPYSTLISAAAIIVPGLEAFVGQYVPGAMVTVGGPSPVAIASARRTLGAVAQ